MFIEKGAGLGSGFTDAQYKAVGAKILPTATKVWAKAEMIMKVKEPIKPEWPHIKEDQVLFTYFHYAADRALTLALKKTKSQLDLANLRITCANSQSGLANRDMQHAYAKPWERPNQILKPCPKEARTLIMATLARGTNSA